MLEATGKDAELLERRKRVLGRHAPLFYDRPVHLVRGEGVWVYDSEGRRYLDAYNNVPHVGHCHPHVLEALNKQARVLNTNTRYLDETIVDYAEKLLGTFDPALSKVSFCCTGSESNELALRMARECTGGMGVISTDWAYHGNTAALMEVSTAFTPPHKRSSNVRTIPVIDPYRQRAGRDDGALTDDYARDVQVAVDGFKERGTRVAALIVCTAFSSEGLPTVPSGYLAKAARIVRDAGGLLIADEVQAGFGRFGSQMWGHEVIGAVPDIVTLGKPMGNGHPMGAVIATAEIVEYFGSRNLHFNTFAGNTVSCAVGRAVLEVLKAENLLINAQTIGELFLDGLRALQVKHSVIGDVRGKGLFFAVDLVKDRDTQAPAPEEAKRVVNAMRNDRGVLISRIGPSDNVLKIRPPMVFSRDNARYLISALDDVLAAL